MKGVFRILLLCAFAGSASARTDEWLPVPADELELKSEPLAPAAPAIYLYRQVDRDDNAPSETVYERIKVLTEQGRDYGDVQLPYRKRWENIDRIRARVIQPDGTIEEFKGEIFDKPLLSSGRDVDSAVKTVSLPNVRVGSIVEYQYRHQLRSGYVNDSQWLLSADLFTRRASFTLHPYRGFLLRWSWPAGLPEGTQAPRREGANVVLETRNVPAFVREDFMPPANSLRLRVDFVYDASTNILDADKFWANYGKDENRAAESFLSNARALKKAVQEIVAPSDSEEAKARKIYARVQRIRNLTYAPEASRAEAEREKRKPIRVATDVWEYGYGNESQITLLLCGLLRAAGIQASYVQLAPRDRWFFDPRLMNPGPLVGKLVLAQVDGRDLYLDVSNPVVPYGLVPWNLTQVHGLKLTDRGGTWIQLPATPPSDARVESRRTVKLAASGDLEGRITVTYTGVEAWKRRFEELNEDEPARKKFLEDDVLGDLPPRAEVRLVNAPEWRDPEVPLVAEFDVKIGGWATAAGRSLVMPVGLLSGATRERFKHPQRVHPIYVWHTYEHSNDVMVDLPAGWQVGTVPKARTVDVKALRYASEVQGESGQLRLKRTLYSNFTLAPPDQYPALRSFFQSVRAGDADQVLVSKVQK